ncbi:tRNA (adenosine(37)-N6)-threonylcarbamoyltransferase complex dimerization subunit type 1 TsaB [Proteinivorax hydrogeniformans]|uniref:tRNA (Adenosine(37)-N6)-threonylcarbamoyltransferase complex dimerization subunit type 1 TsaB n=1 Tax=Proteinivorax hydrogeniformans TaxID=1826727 RepID=A0AAU8HTG8_9FIRM
MLILSIDTSTLTCSIAVNDGEALLGQQVINTKTTHSQKLLPCIKSLLDNLNISLRDIQLIAIAKGPGSFTGLRIGMATAKGLAYGLKIPIVGVSSLEALAYSSNVFGSLVVPIFNARRNQVYGAIYEYDQNRYIEKLTPKSIQLNDLLDEIEKVGKTAVFLGDYLQSFEEQIKEKLGNKGRYVLPQNITPRASGVGYLAYNKFNKAGGDDLASLDVEYLRLAEAQRKLLQCSRQS